MIAVARARPTSRGLPFGSVALFALLAGCGFGPGCERSEAPLAPAWISLARGFRPAPVEALNAAWARSEPPLAVRSDESGAGVWIDHRIEPSDWRRVEARSLGRFEEWWTERPSTAGFQHRDGERVELRLEGRAIARHEQRAVRKLVEQGDLGDDYFFLDGERITFPRPQGKGPPPVGVFSSWLERGHEQNGVWRATVEMLVGDGFTLWPGERLELVRDVPPASALRFVTVSRSLGREGKLLFRVLLDGDVLLEHQQEGEHESVAHVLALPPAGRAAARLTFEVRGPPAASAFLEPVIGPAEIGTYGARPWTQARPDLVVFLADTFRADNLAAYGGAADLCPELNRLGQRSVRFLRARSASVWTLPSHAALFTGLHPPQHGAVARGSTFPAELATLAEHLESAGYRTGAVTDSLFVSRHYGFDQGFGWFLEQDFDERRLRRTLAWADDFLVRDDGRPVFLFVHTYRTHIPYRQGPEESEAELVSFRRRVLGSARTSGTEKPGYEKLDREKLDQMLRSFLPEYLELYHGAARALDAEVGPWFEACEQRGLFRRGYLVFTSDHGEAFFEHGTREHTGRPHEEKVRIPLLLSGSGLAPRDVLFGAQHVDLAPTLSALAGLPPVAGWVGTPLLELDHERVLFSYNQDGRGAYLAAVEGEQKLLETAEPGARPRGAFDEVYALATDPLERQNLAAADPAWARDLAARSAELLDGFFQRMREPAAVDLPEDLRADLEALGYGE